MKHLDVQNSRRLVSLVIRRWRATLYLLGENLPDRDLAKLVGVTASTFSRLSSGTSTASLPVYRSIQVAMIDTVGYSAMRNIFDFCKSKIYGNEIPSA